VSKFVKITTMWTDVSISGAPPLITRWLHFKRWWKIVTIYLLHTSTSQFVLQAENILNVLVFGLMKLSS